MSAILHQAVMAALGGAAAAEGVPAPTLTGSPTLLASWDFDAASTITLSGSDIDQISGADGTSYTLLTPGNMPAQATVSGKKVAQFASASSEYMQIASDVGVGTGACTIVAVLQLTSNASVQGIVDIANGASGLTLNRHLLFFNNGAGTGFTHRKGDGAGSQDANNGTVQATGMYLAIGRSATGTDNSRIHVNGQGTAGASAGANGLPTGISHTTVGARRASGSQGIYGNYDLFRVLIYSGDIGTTAVEEIAVWANTNYGTTNAA